METRDGAASVHCATLPLLVCEHLRADPRLKVLSAPVDLGTFPVDLGWHVRYRNDPARRWLRSTVAALARELGDVAPKIR